MDITGRVYVSPDEVRVILADIGLVVALATFAGALLAGIVVELVKRIK